MKKSLMPFTLLVVVALLAGCETSGISGRIQEKSTVFSNLTPEQQELIKAGDIDAGFTQDMVYMALGTPSKTETKESPDGPVTMWTYNRYYPSNRAVSINVSYATGMDSVSPRANPYANQTPRNGVPTTDQTRTRFADNSGPTMAPEPADLPADTLYVFFFKGQVFDLKLASQG